MTNFGLLVEKDVRAKDWICGGVTGILGEELTDGQWDAYLPLFEAQHKNGFDTFSCVTFSALNCIEALFKRKYDENVNFSDRAIAKLSNTTPTGNYLSTVADSVVKFGLVDESIWPYGGKNWSEYMTEVPNEVLKTGELFNTRYKINWEWVYDRDPATLMELLKKAPLQVTVFAWNGMSSGIYTKTTNRQNHAVMLYGFEKNKYWKIYDHYIDETKELSWDFDFGSILKYNLETLMEKKTIPSDTLVQKVDGAGGIALALDGKLIIDDVAKVLAVWMVRNGGDVKGKTIAVKSDIWDSMPHINLKKEYVG